MTLLSLTTTLKCSWSLGKTRIHWRSRRLVTKMSLSPGPCQNIFWGFLSHVTNSIGATECLMLMLLEIRGCLLFQESEVLNSAPSVSGVEPGCDQIFGGSWSCGEEVKLLYLPVSLNFYVLLETLKLPGYQGGNRSFFDLLLPVNCMSVPEEESNKFKCGGMSCVFLFWCLSCEWNLWKG